jgi:hypothetical protein
VHAGGVWGCGIQYDALGMEGILECGWEWRLDLSYTFGIKYFIMLVSTAIRQKVYGHLPELRDFIRTRLLQRFVHSAGKGHSSDIFIIASSRREEAGYLNRALWEGVVNIRVQAGRAERVHRILT